MINVKNISKTFDDVKAVTDLSFEINQGEIVGLLGPNGAGKTTTMRLMSGFLSPDKGDVLIDNVSVIADSVGVQQVIGYLPENNPLYTEMLVSDFLTYSAQLRDLNGKALKESLSFAVKAVNIADVYYRPIKELSKGFKQRVGIAAALLHKPKVLILDEPTEGLDPNQRNEIRSLIKDLAKEHTIVISTHVMQEVEALCTRMILINKGELVVDGSVSDLSKTQGDSLVFEVEIEGKNVVEKIKKLPNIECTVESSNKNIHKFRIVTSKDRKLQPEISKLVVANDWIIWSLVQESRQLEDVFRELTQGN